MASHSRYTYLTALALSVVAIGCGGGTSSNRAERPAANVLRIGLLMDTSHERWQRDRDAFVERARTLGAEVDVQFAEGDAARQATLADEMLGRGIKVLVLVPSDSDKAASIVQGAKAKNVAVISYDRLVQNADVDLYVTFNNEKVGEMQAQFLVNRAPKGNYIVLGGAPTDSNAKQYRAGQMKVLKEAVDRGDIRIVADPWVEGWSADEAYKLTKAAIEKARGRVAAVVASNDVTAGGAVRALEEKGLAGKVLVSGQDAELEAARRIVQGTQAMTVYKPVPTLARLAARAAVQLANGERLDTVTTVNNGQKDVPTMLLEPITVEKGNLDALLIQDGFHTREQVYGKT